MGEAHAAVLHDTSSKIEQGGTSSNFSHPTSWPSSVLPITLLVVSPQYFKAGVIQIGEVTLIPDSPHNWFYVHHGRRSNLVGVPEADLCFVAAAQAAKEGMWLHHLLQELQVCIDLPFTHFIDNQSCIALARNPVIMRRPNMWTSSTTGAGRRREAAAGVYVHKPYVGRQPHESSPYS